MDAASHWVTVATTLLMSSSGPGAATGEADAPSPTMHALRLLLPALVAVVTSALVSAWRRRRSDVCSAADIYLPPPAGPVGWVRAWIGLAPATATFCSSARLGMKNGNYSGRSMSPLFQAVLQHAMDLLVSTCNCTCAYVVDEIPLGNVDSPLVFPVLTRPLEVAPGILLSTSVNSKCADDADLSSLSKTSVEVKDLRICLTHTKGARGARGARGGGIAPIMAFARACQAEYERRQKLELIKSQKIFSLDVGSDVSGGGGIFDWNEQPFSTSKSFDSMFFEGKRRVLDRIARFSDPAARAEDDRLGLPHTLGFMLFGEPGTGKTSFIKSLAKLTRRHVMSIPARAIRTRDQLFEVFRNERVSSHRGSGYVIPYERRLYVFEDIDCCDWRDIVQVRSRGNESGCGGGPQADASSEAAAGLAMAMAMARLVRATSATSASPEGAEDLEGPEGPEGGRGKGKGKGGESTVRLSDLLEVLDGILEMPGRMLVITSNNPDAIDPALLRPGRVDELIHFGRMSAADVRRMAELWLGEGAVDAAAAEVPGLAEALRVGDVTQAELGALLYSTRDFLSGFSFGMAASPPPERK